MNQARVKALQSMEREEAARVAREAAEEHEAAAAAPAPHELVAPKDGGGGGSTSVSFAVGTGGVNGEDAGANGHSGGQAHRPHRHASLFQVHAWLANRMGSLSDCAWRATPEPGFLH